MDLMCSPGYCIGYMSMTTRPKKLTVCLEAQYRFLRAVRLMLTRKTVSMSLCEREDACQRKPYHVV